MTSKGCELCGDNDGPMHVKARCHMTAPLRAELDGGILTLYCYVPTCNRIVVQMRVTALGAQSPQTGEQNLRAALLAILDAVDFTQGACRINEQVGAVLPVALIENARKALG